MNETGREDSPSLEKLLEDLKRHEWSVNWITADALAKIGQDAFPHLVKALQSEDGYVRNGAAIALGKIGNREAIQPLLQALQWRDERVYEDDEDQEARVSAATAFGKLRDPSTCAPLLTELERILETDSTLASYIIESLGEIANPQAIPVLARMVEFGDGDIQKLASWALAQMGEKGVEILLCVARDRTRRGRQYAVRALGVSKDESVLPVLIAVLRDRSDDKYVRGEAARALGRIGKSPDIRPVLLAILETPGDDVKSSALAGLGYLRDSAAYEAIIKQLEDIHLRYTAVMALGELGDPRACELLISMLRSEDHSLRLHAATALGKIGCSNAIPALIELRDRRTDSLDLAAERATVQATIKLLQDREANK